MAEFVGTLLGAGFVWLASLYFRNKVVQRTWRGAADELDFDYDHDGFGREGLRIEGTIGGVDVFAYTEAKSAGLGQKQLFTVYEATYEQRGLHEEANKGIVDQRDALIHDVERIAEQVRLEYDG